MPIISRREIVPFMTMKKVLIVTLESDIRWRKKSTKIFIRNAARISKLLSFSPTQVEAFSLYQELSEDIRMVYYDGNERIRNATPGIDFECEMYLSYAHGPISQAIDMPQFKIVAIDCNIRKPKFCFGPGMHLLSTDPRAVEYQMQNDTVTTCRQCFGRIMRATCLEDSFAPRTGIFFGPNSRMVGEEVTKYFLDSSHNVTLVHCNENRDYLFEIVQKWASGESIDEMLSLGPRAYEEKYKMEAIKSEVSSFLATVEEPKWSEVVKKIPDIRSLNKDNKNTMKEWFQNLIKEQRRKKRQKKKCKNLKIKILQHIEKNGRLSWSDAYRKFNLNREPSETQEAIKTMLEKGEENDSESNTENSKPG